MRLLKQLVFIVAGGLWFAGIGGAFWALYKISWWVACGLLGFWVVHMLKDEI